MEDFFSTSVTVEDIVHELMVAWDAREEGGDEQYFWKVVRRLYHRRPLTPEELDQLLELVAPPSDIPQWSWVEITTTDHTG